MPEIVPVTNVESLLSTIWNTSNVPLPIFIDANNASDPLRFNMVERNQDVIVLRSDIPTLDEKPIGTWVYGNQISRVLLDIYTNADRQRLYNLQREIRRICHSQMHLMTNYQRIQFVSFNEIVQTQMNIWNGRCIIELLNSAILLNINN